MGNREQNSAFSFLPRTSSRGCIFSLPPRTVRRAVNGDTWMAILAAHTAENELRTFSIVFLIGKSLKNHERLHCLAGGMEFCTRGFRAYPKTKSYQKNEAGGVLVDDPIAKLQISGRFPQRSVKPFFHNIFEFRLQISRSQDPPVFKLSHP